VIVDAPLIITSPRRWYEKTQKPMGYIIPDVEEKQREEGGKAESEMEGEGGSGVNG
jgi:hypothetical protein